MDEIKDNIKLQEKVLLDDYMVGLHNGLVTALNIITGQQYPLKSQKDIKGIDDITGIVYDTKI